MKKLCLAFLFCTVLFSGFIQNSFGQNPTVISDSLVIMQRLHAKEELIVDQDALFKGEIHVIGESRFETDVRFDEGVKVDGTAKLNGVVKMENLESVNLTESSEILIILPNGQLKKGNIAGILSETLPPAELDFCGAENGVPKWWAGINKLFTACQETNVGIATTNPLHKLHVVGVTYAQKFLAGNVSANTAAYINAFGTNSETGLLNLGIKIGGGLEELRFSIGADGNIYSKNISSQPTLVINNGTGHAIIIYANNGNKILQFEDNGTTNIFSNNGVKTLELKNDGTLTWRNNGGNGFIAKNSSGAEILKLNDAGILYSKEIIVTVPPFPDYVFENEYELMPLPEVKNFVENNKRLPGIPSADEFAKNGLSVGEMQVKQMEKIENIYLYLFELDEKIKNLEEENESLKKELNSLKK